MAIAQPILEGPHHVNSDITTDEIETTLMWDIYNFPEIFKEDRQGFLDSPQLKTNFNSYVIRMYIHGFIYGGKCDCETRSLAKKCHCAQCNCFRIVCVCHPCHCLKYPCSKTPESTSSTSNKDIEVMKDKNYIFALSLLRINFRNDMKSYALIGSFKIKKHMAMHQAGGATTKEVKNLYKSDQPNDCLSEQKWLYNEKDFAHVIRITCTVKETINDLLSLTQKELEIPKTPKSKTSKSPKSKSEKKLLKIAGEIKRKLSRSPKDSESKGGSSQEQGRSKKTKTYTTDA